MNVWILDTMSCYPRMNMYTTPSEDSGPLQQPSIKGKSQKIGESQYHSYAAVQDEASHGWAVRRQKTNVKISQAVEEYLTRVFNEGTKDGQPKANPADVAEDLKKKFTKPEWLEVQTIKGYFSRLAALQRGQEIREMWRSQEKNSFTN